MKKDADFFGVVPDADASVDNASFPGGDLADDASIGDFSLFFSSG